MPKFRKKPVEIEAFQFTTVYSYARIVEWIKSCSATHKVPGDYISFSHGKIYMGTIDGEKIVSFGDWIIKRDLGDFYPCDYRTFEATYDPVESKSAPEYPKATPKELRTRAF
jgi:hypothetical protein